MRPSELEQVLIERQLAKRKVLSTDFFSSLPFPDYHHQLQSSRSPDPFECQQQLTLQQDVQAPSRRYSSISQHSRNSILSHACPRHSTDALSEAYSSSEAGSAVDSGGQDELVSAESAPMENDMMLRYFSHMLMEEEMADQSCTCVKQCSPYQPYQAWQAMKEFADLIGDESLRGSPTTDENWYGAPFHSVSAAEGDEAETDREVNSWIDEIFDSNPHDFLHEEHFSGDLYCAGADLADEVSSITAGITDITTGSPESWSTGSTPNEATPAAAAPAIAKRNDVYDCPYLENDRPENAIVDYMNGRSGIESLVDLYPFLMQFAQMVATDNVGEAHHLIDNLRRMTSPSGDGGQRMAYYMVEALIARLSGTGAQLHTALINSTPSAMEMLNAYRMYVRCNPLPKISHFFANGTISKAVQGSDRIHIVDYGILYGVQWPSLLKKLCTREGGVTHVRITGIDFARPGFQKHDMVGETGRRLQAKAKELGVELEFHALVGKWENITAAQLQLRDDETLVVNCMFRLRNLLDETVMASSSRKTVLSRIHSLNPKVFVMGVISAGYNSPFFMARVREAVTHFSAVFDSLHTTVSPDAAWRRLLEKEILGREILNVIACEGTDRIERAETYRQWQSRSLNAGFRQLPLDSAITAKSHDVLKNFNRNYGIAVDGNWLLSGWRDRVLHGLTAWTCA
ncbi:unnamed protein product [Calypogeia fissa]